MFLHKSESRAKISERFMGGKIWDGKDPFPRPKNRTDDFPEVKQSFSFKPPAENEVTWQYGRAPYQAEPVSWGLNNQMQKVRAPDIFFFCFGHLTFCQLTGGAARELGGTARSGL